MGEEEGRGRKEGEEGEGKKGGGAGMRLAMYF